MHLKNITKQWREFISLQCRHKQHPYIFITNIACLPFLSAKRRILEPLRVLKQADRMQRFNVAIIAVRILMLRRQSTDYKQCSMSNASDLVDTRSHYIAMRKNMHARSSGLLSNRNRCDVKSNPIYHLSWRLFTRRLVLAASLDLDLAAGGAAVVEPTAGVGGVSSTTCSSSDSCFLTLTWIKQDYYNS